MSELLNLRLHNYYERKRTVVVFCATGEYRRSRTRQEQGVRTSRKLIHVILVGQDGVLLLIPAPLEGLAFGLDVPVLTPLVVIPYLELFINSHNVCS